MSLGMDWIVSNRCVVKPSLLGIFLFEVANTAYLFTVSSFFSFVSSSIAGKSASADSKKPSIVKEGTEKYYFAFSESNKPSISIFEFES